MILCHEININFLRCEHNIMFMLENILGDLLRILMLAGKVSSFLQLKGFYLKMYICLYIYLYIYIEIQT